MIKNRHGASSVLIILMMVVLVVFGLAALTTSLAAMRLTEKSGEWTGEYYALEAEAEKIVFKVDSILFTAESEALEYIESGSYLNETGRVFDAELQLMINNSYVNAIPPAASGDYLSNVLEAAFYQIAVEKLQAEFPESLIEFEAGFQRRIIEEEKFTGVTFSTTISEDDGEFSKNLDIAMQIISPSYKIEVDGSSASGTRLPSPIKRFEITSWREWQEYFDYSEKMQFTDLTD